LEPFLFRVAHGKPGNKSALLETLHVDSNHALGRRGYYLIENSACLRFHFAKWAVYALPTFDGTVTLSGYFYHVKNLGERSTLKMSARTLGDRHGRVIFSAPLCIFNNWERGRSDFFDLLCSFAGTCYHRHVSARHANNNRRGTPDKLPAHKGERLIGVYCAVFERDIFRRNILVAFMDSHIFFAFGDDLRSLGFETVVVLSACCGCRIFAFSLLA
jgi:hypothetical protein